MIMQTFRFHVLRVYYLWSPMQASEARTLNVRFGFDTLLSSVSEEEDERFSRLRLRGDYYLNICMT